MNHDDLFPILVVFPVLVGMVLVWFVLIHSLFRRLAKFHARKYEAMGRPTLFLRNNIATTWATLKFLVRREHSTLGDQSLSKLADFMLVFLVVYLVLFTGLATLFAVLAS